MLINTIGIQYFRDKKEPEIAAIKKNLLVTASTFPKSRDDTTPAFVLELSKRLTDEYNVHVLAPHSHGSEKHEVIDGVHVHRFRFFPTKKLFTDGAIMSMLKRHKWLYLQVPFFLLAQLFSMIILVRKHRIRTIHAHWIIPQGLVAVLYKKLFNQKVSVMITSHGGDIHGLTSKRMKKLKRWVINNSTAMTTVSNELRNEVRNLGVSYSIPIEVIPMGVDLALFSPERYDESLKDELCINGAFLLYVGTLRELKGVNYLINAMPRVVGEYPNTKLIIIGDGEERAALERQAGDLDLLGRNIIFLGAKRNDELPKYYATADIFISPSLREGLPVAYIEALGSGCPVITSDLPTIADIITDEETGFIVRQKSSAEISDKILLLLIDSDLCDNVSKKGRDYVLKKFDWKIVGEKYASFLKNAL